MELRAVIRCLTIVGLVLNIVGTMIVFKWGAPQPDFSDYVAISLEGPMADKAAEDARRLRRQYTMMSRIGLGLLGLGFLVQVIAVAI